MKIKDYICTMDNGITFYISDKKINSVWKVSEYIGDDISTRLYELANENPLYFACEEVSQLRHKTIRIATFEVVKELSKMDKVENLFEFLEKMDLEKICIKVIKNHFMKL